MFLVHYPIPTGSYLCTYSESPMSEREVDASDSSRSYVISCEVSGAHVLYDAEFETGNNLARFANQPGVIEALEKTVQLSDKKKFTEMSEEDWRNINKIVESHCNAVYSKKGDTMVLLAKDNIPANSDSMEIFASYGDMREYWVKAIAESPRRFPEPFSKIVKWLLTSEECNWTDDQKMRWAGTNVCTW